MCEKLEMKLKQYSVVKLQGIKKQFKDEDLKFNKRHPRIGDIATIVEIYEQPTLGYELECSEENGATEWLVTFSPSEACFELMS